MTSNPCFDFNGAPMKREREGEREREKEAGGGGVGGKMRAPSGSGLSA